MNKRPARTVSKKMNKTAQHSLNVLGLMTDLQEWLESDKAVAYDDLSFFIHSTLEGVELDTKNRLFIFSKKNRLTFQELAGWIQKKKNIKALADVYDALVSWMEFDYDPEGIDTNDDEEVELLNDEIDDWVESL